MDATSPRRPPSLAAVLRSIQDTMRKDAGVDGDAQRLAQLVWLLFLKVLDEREAARERAGGYRSPIPEPLRWHSWARGGATGDALLGFVDRRLFPGLRDLRAPRRGGGAAGVVVRLVRGVFGDARNAMTSGALLRRVIDTLDALELAAADRHAIGDVYETLLADLQSAGNAGEFYTPRAITRFIVEQIDPRLGETVLDPACGTGGFLVSALEHVRAREVRDAAGEAVLQASLHGVDKKPLPHLLCVTNLMVHGVALPATIRRGNALARPAERSTRGARPRVDVVISNPPFGGLEEDAIARGFPVRLRSRDTAALFLATILDRLAPGGRAAVVIPDGELMFQTTGVHARIKQQLLASCDLHTVVRLPRGAFRPYTDSRTSILFFTRGAPTRAIWFYDQPCPAAGYSTRRPIRFAEFAATQAWWHARRATEHAWQVDVAEIRARGFNLDIAPPRRAGSAGRGTPELAADHRSAVTAADQARRALCDELRACLAATTEAPGGEDAALRRLVDHLDVITSGAAGVRRVREAIFECAVTGRLVAPCTADEAASPASTASPAGPRSLPPGWAWARFEQVASIDAHRVSPAQFPDEPHVAPDSIEKATGRLLAVRSVRDDGVTSTKHRFFAGQVLYAKIRPNLSKAVRVDFDGLCSADMYPLTPRIDARYFHSYLLSRTFRDQVVQADRRLTVPKVNQAQLLATLVAVPPPGEQRRIADQVDRLIARCDELERELQRQDQRAAALSDGVLADVVGPAASPRG
jgi:type I restriction-modification system DNA methylase subunit